MCKKSRGEENSAERSWIFSSSLICFINTIHLQVVILDYSRTCHHPKLAIGPLKMKKGDVVKTVLEIKSAKMSKLSVQDVIFSYALTVLKHITVNNGFFVLKRVIS
jgi:hypothetical protein